MNAISTISHETYLLDPCERPSLSASIITLLCNDSPLHAWTAHPRLNPDYVPEYTKATDIGSVVHALLLEGSCVAEVLDFEDWRTNKAKDSRQSARAAGKVPVLRKDWPDIEAMVNAALIQLQAHKEASDAFTKGKPEQTLTWEEDGIHCRARLDWLHDDLKRIDDYKSAVNANPEAWTRAMFGYGCDIQACWYLRGLKAVTGNGATFRWIVQEKQAPYALSVIGPGPDVLMLAEKKIMYAMDIWRTCLETGKWPAYPNRICWASLPPWEESRWIAKEEMSTL